MDRTLRRSPRVLIIDDDQSLLEAYAVLLEDEFRVYTAATGEDGLAYLQREDIDLLLLDLRLPSMDGLEVLRRVKVIDDRVAVIVITAMNEARLAAEAFKLGVAEYLVKPFDIKPTLALLRHTLKGRQEALDIPRPLEEATSPLPPHCMVGRSPQMRQLFTLLSRVADTDATVLISGETGVGKELIARALHQQSRRRAHPLTVVNCAAITEPLAESMLFGHERGAFTGAVIRHRGAFERAQTGTLFLDEIGSLRLEVQAKLLRVLQEHTFERVGGEEALHVDMRVIAASNQDLRHQVAVGLFREDLFYRLQMVPLVVPPLRDRIEDIPLLVRHFLPKYNQAFGRHVPGLTLEALAALGRYPWPGNVRELEYLIARLVATSRPRQIDIADLPSEFRSG